MAQRFFLAVLMASTISAAARAEIDQSTPEKTVESFVSSFNSFKVDDCLACIKNSKKESCTEEFFDLLKGAGARLEAKILGTKTTETVAFVTVKGAIIAAKKTNPTMQEDVRLELKDGKWYIVCAIPGGDSTPINNMAFSVAAAGLVIEPLREGKRKDQCLHQAKDLATAFLQYAADHDDLYPPKADAWRKAVLPYLKDVKILTCPCDALGVVSYSFNPNLAGKAELQFDPKTVVIYEGSKGKLLFRHLGRAAVGFCDGSSRMVTPEEAKKLKWK